MTPKEYEKICKLIDQSAVELWITPMKVIRCITPMSAENLKTKIKTLVKRNYLNDNRTIRKKKR